MWAHFRRSFASAAEWADPANSGSVDVDKLVMPGCFEPPDCEEPEAEPELHRHQRTMTPADAGDDDDKQAKQKEKEAFALTKAAAQGNFQADAIIAVTGLTGTGKSTFIQLLTEENVKIGHSLESCTADVGVYGFTGPQGQSIAIIDTPGFDDTHRTDSEVLEEVAYFLGQIYKQKMQLAGIIYLHRITDNRMTGSASKNLAMFQDLCGEDCLPSVVLGTTMWEIIDDPEQYQKAVARETQLREEYWSGMLGGGSRMFRHDNNRRSALRFIDAILSTRGEQPVVLKIQHELIDAELPLVKTNAGQRLQKDLVEQTEKHARELQRMQASHQAAIKARNQKMADEIAMMKQKAQADLRKAEQDGAKMHRDFRQLAADSEKRYQAMLHQAEADRAKLQDEIDAKDSELDGLARKQQELQERLDDEKSDRASKESAYRAQLAAQLQAVAASADRSKRDMEEYRRQAADLERRRRQGGALAVVQTLAGLVVVGAGIWTGQAGLVAGGGSIMGNAATSNW